MKEEAHGGAKAGSGSHGSAVASTDAIFHVRDVAKVHSMGETKVHLGVTAASSG